MKLSVGLAGLLSLLPLAFGQAAEYGQCKRFRISKS